MDKGTLVLLIPVLGISIGLVAVIGHHFGNYLRMKHGYAPLNQNGKPVGTEGPALQNELVALKIEVDKLRPLKDQMERVEERLRVLERIATDPVRRLEADIETLR